MRLFVNYLLKMHRLRVLTLVFFAGFLLPACTVSPNVLSHSELAIQTQDRGKELHRPNIIIVLTDDLGFGDIGPNGATSIATPHLDRMANEGVSLTSFYAAANVCTPSRAGLLTGRQPIRMGLAAGVIFPQSTHGLTQDEVTISEMLQTRGYRTAMIGKWHLGHTAEFWPTEQGFDTFFGVPYSNDMTPFPLYDQNEKIEEPVDQTTLTRRYTERAVEVIENQSDQPFFLYLAHTFPHIPLYAEAPFLGASEAGLYGDTIETLDWSMGELFSALARTRSDRDTLVIFTSDNGPWFEGSSGASRDRKGGTWEGAYRVPFLAWWPGTLPAGEERGAPVSALDLMPTIDGLTRAEQAAPDDASAFDGEDIWRVLQNGAPSPHEHLLFFDEDQIAAIRKGDWRLVLRSYYKTYDVPLQAFNYPLLFNLKKDPGENYSLTDREPELVAELIEIVEREAAELGVVPKTSISIEEAE